MCRVFSKISRGLDPVSNCFKQYGWLIKSDFWFSLKSLRDWPLFMCCLSLPIFPLAAFFVEKSVKQKYMPEWPSCPRTSCIRKGWVIRQIIKLYINPILQNSQHPLKGDLLYAVERVWKLSVPNLCVALHVLLLFPPLVPLVLLTNYLQYKFLPIKLKSLRSPLHFKTIRDHLRDARY